MRVMNGGRVSGMHGRIPTSSGHDCTPPDWQCRRRLAAKPLELAAELAGISEAANVIYDGEKLDTSTFGSSLLPNSFTGACRDSRTASGSLSDVVLRTLDGGPLARVASPVPPR